ncbi:MAG: outer membrane beta-barrel protein [Akkermansiaceae bacterium]|nr:outer membrane beta-barrel protein [Verrucomicrobiales bacterium]
MKFDKWTLGLAAIGVVSLASASKAVANDTVSAVETAVASTTLSGYVDTAMQWNPGTGNENLPPYSFGGETKADGFSLNVVQLSLAKPLDESEWAAGYRFDGWFGPDASRLGTQSINADSSGDFAIRQAYVNLRAPLGNGLDIKVGAFDTIIGYESVASPNNPNYTRSYGQTIEPQTHTGVLLSYRFNDMLSLSAGVANTHGPRINDRAQYDKAESFKTYMTSMAITAPESFGFLAGSTMYAGIISGFSGSYEENMTSYYVGTTLATPVSGLRIGAAWDYLDVHNIDFGTEDGVAWAAALYASFQATEKLSLHLRGEYLDDQAEYFYGSSDSPISGDLSGTGFRVWAATATVQYDLWKNVLSRVECRWDHSDSGIKYFGQESSRRRNALMVAANLIYKF